MSPLLARTRVAYPYKVLSSGSSIRLIIDLESSDTYYTSSFILPAVSNVIANFNPYSAIAIVIMLYNGITPKSALGSDGTP